MRFKSKALMAEFATRLHPEAARVAQELDSWLREQHWPRLEFTSISRDAGWYERNGLLAPLFSWHLVDCAWDMRIRHYTPEHLTTIEAWLREKCSGPQWELVFRLHGTGPHFHVAYRCFARRKAYATRPLNQE